jgi:hypothetical protein
VKNSQPRFHHGARGNGSGRLLDTPRPHSALNKPHAVFSVFEKPHMNGVAGARDIMIIYEDGVIKMAETLGSLCDKLTIVKLKQYHCDNADKGASLAIQETQLVQEIDCFISAALSGEIPAERLTFSSNKVYKQAGNELSAIEKTSLGGIFAELAKVNGDLWHEQEKVYEFEKVPVAEKDKVVKQLALLNLRRTQCIDAIDKALLGTVQKKGESHVH